MNLLKVLSEYSPKLLASGDIRMRCPFRENHKDGSGRMSFFISPEIGAYHCFSCGAKGSAVHLLTTKFGVPYFEAVEMVRLTEYHKEKVEFDLDMSWDIEPPKSFLERGFTKDTLEHFRLGTSGDWDIIPFYEDFSHPVTLVGYQKRKDKPHRVVQNNRDFKKSSYLYNYDKGYEYTILVEGYSDVFRLYQYGYQAVALLGTSLSLEQINKLAYYKRIYLALDNDLSGRIATEKVVYFLQKHTELFLVPYTTKDPGECKIKTDWINSFKNSTDYLDYSIQMAMNWDGYIEMKEKALSEVV